MDFFGRKALHLDWTAYSAQHRAGKANYTRTLVTMLGLQVRSELFALAS
jgi:hypothetical protein